MHNVKTLRTFIILILGITILITAVLGILYLYRFSQNLRAQFTRQALLSAQIFAESLSPDEPSRQLLMTARAFVQGDVLYAQIIQGGKVSVETHAEATLDLGLPVENFPGHLVQRENRLQDGTPYLDVLRPFTGEISTSMGSVPDYVRVGFSLRGMEAIWDAETLTVIKAGSLIIILMSLLGGAYWLSFRPRPIRAPQGWPSEPYADRGRVGPRHELIQAGLLRIDPASKEVHLRDERVDLSPKEYELASLLASEPGRVFSTREILEKVWSDGNSATDKDVKQYIYLLRKKLEVDPEHPQVIVTVRGFGYKLIPRDHPLG